ncbi:hypothetical protein HHK36_015461 [Tetracentron sinense]|uniref:Mitochondrial carrier protein n=1 Tax=Tetracentron sinense TaxID=13715 RepID=A0A834Z780_TETSI|nr:hypothetical protein HHK36_015461 [Tetracentron sinense]
MAVSDSSSDEIHVTRSRFTDTTNNRFFMLNFLIAFCNVVWREFLWGAVAGAFGEGMMHPIDTIKTRIQSQAVISGCQSQKGIFQMVRTVWVTDGLRGFYRGVTPGLTGSLATGATYFGVIESTKKWVEELHPNLGGHWSHFIAGGVGDTLGSFIYVPCEVMKQRMQVQGTRKSWNSIVMKENVCKKPSMQMYGYYSGIFQAGCSIWKDQGLRGLYAGYWSTLARDVPFAGLMVTFYEALKDLTEYGKQRWLPNSDCYLNSSIEGLLLGGLAGGFSAYLTTPLDVIKTRLQVQGSTIRYQILTFYGMLIFEGTMVMEQKKKERLYPLIFLCFVRYNGWLDAIQRTWIAEGTKGMFRGSVPRIIWYIPASALTFMAVEFLREHFDDGIDSSDVREVASLSIDKKRSALQEVA